MSTATKERESKVLFFSIEGENFTNLIRDAWVSDLPHKAIAMCTEGLMGCPINIAIDICTGKSKLVGDTREGDHTLGLEDDAESEYHGVALDIPTMVGRLEKIFIDQSNARLDCFRRKNFYTQLATPEGAYYRVSGNRRTGRVSEFFDFDMVSDEKRIIWATEKIEDAMKGLQILYPLVGKDMTDLPTDKVTGYLSFEESGNPQLYRNLQVDDIMPDTDEELLSEQDLADEVEDDENVLEALGSLRKDDGKNKITTPYGEMTTQFEVKQERTPTTIDEVNSETDLGSGWILPDGTMYLDKAIAWIHVHILDQLDEMGYFKGKDINASERSVQEEGNWVKYSGWDFYLWHIKTTDQVQSIIEYTMACDDDTIRIGGSGSVKMEHFAELLNKDASFEGIDKGWQLRSAHQKIWGELPNND